MESKRLGDLEISTSREALMSKRLTSLEQQRFALALKKWKRFAIWESLRLEAIRNAGLNFIS